MQVIPFPLDIVDYEELLAPINRSDEPTGGSYGCDFVTGGRLWWW
jgi:hypothetical protein